MANLLGSGIHSCTGSPQAVGKLLGLDSKTSARSLKSEQLLARRECFFSVRGTVALGGHSGKTRGAKIFSFADRPTALGEGKSPEAREERPDSRLLRGARSALADVRRPRPPPAGRCRSRAAPAVPGAPYRGERGRAGRPQGPGSERARRRVRVWKSPPSPAPSPPGGRPGCQQRGRQPCGQGERGEGGRRKRAGSGGGWGGEAGGRGRGQPEEIKRPRHELGGGLQRGGPPRPPFPHGARREQRRPARSRRSGHTRTRGAGGRRGRAGRGGRQMKMAMSVIQACRSLALSTWLLSFCFVHLLCLDFTVAEKEEWYTAFVNITYADPAGGGAELRSEKSECGRYGDQSPKQDARGQVALSASPADRYACDPGTRFNAPAPGKSWVALIPRGNCTYKDKIRHAAAQNASAVVIYNVGSSNANETVTMPYAGELPCPLSPRGRTPRAGPRFSPAVCAPVPKSLGDAKFGVVGGTDGPRVRWGAPALCCGPGEDPPSGAVPKRG